MLSDSVDGHHGDKEPYSGAEFKLLRSFADEESGSCSRGLGLWFAGPNANFGAAIGLAL